MLTLKSCSSGWTPSRDAYNGLANFPVSQPGVRGAFLQLLRNQNFNPLSCRCTPLTSANDGASCGFAIFRRAARKWPDQSIQRRLPGLILNWSLSPINKRLSRATSEDTFRVCSSPDAGVAEMMAQSSGSFRLNQRNVAAFSRVHRSRATSPGREQPGCRPCLHSDAYARSALLYAVLRRPRSWALEDAKTEIIRGVLEYPHTLRRHFTETAVRD